MGVILAIVGQDWTSDDWLKILGGVGTLFGIISAALGAWWLKIKDKEIELKKSDAENRREEMKLEHQIKREDTEEVKRVGLAALAEKQQLIDQQHAQMEVQREDLHKERNMNQTLINQIYEMRLQLQGCEQDRKYQRRMIDALYETLTAAGMKVPMPEPEPLPLPMIPPPSTSQSQGKGGVA